MKRFLKILLGLGVFTLLMVSVVFGLRFYNSQKYGWSEEKLFDYYDLTAYPESFESGTINYFEEGKVTGFHLLPEDPVVAETIVVFGGSEGSSNFDLSVQLAEEGYEVYSLFFFGAPNQNKELTQIPLEFFQDFLDYATLNDEAITVIGASKGAELGLVLTNYYDEIANLALYTPSNYVYQGLSLSREIHSSWVWEGEELPFISLQQSNFGAFVKNVFGSMILKPVKYRETYVSAVEMNDNAEAAKINTSNFDGQALLMAGEKDALWQGDIAAKEIGEALGENAIVDLYPEAGHLFGLPPYVNGLDLGGTLEANEAAKVSSDQKLFEFLKNNRMN